ncbi:hypothetical protein [Pectinatus frisingensis]|nr:hypothetical protein [Pectinatus frisingensis]
MRRWICTEKAVMRMKEDLLDQVLRNAVVRASYTVGTIQIGNEGLWQKII